MFKLALVAGMMVLAFVLDTPQTRAGMPMMDEPILLGVHGNAGCSKRNCITTKERDRQNEVGARWGYNGSGYNLYRDRSGYGANPAHDRVAPLTGAGNREP